MTYLLIERADGEGAKRIAMWDRISAVADDGTTVDISMLVKGWQVNARHGELEQATLYMMGVRVVEKPDLVPSPKPT
jgi:hypothetical protein